nr:acetyltransferase (GNAT) domain protein [uncultured bacterium]
MDWFKDRLTLKKNLLYAYKGAPRDVPELPEGYDFTELDEALVEGFFSSPQDVGRRARYLRFLQQGSRGFMVHEGDQWAAVGWVVPAQARGLPAHLPAAVTTHPWLTEAHTRPEYRGRGLHKFLLAKRLAILAEENLGSPVTAMSDVGVQNVASRRSHISSGFEPSGWVYAWTLRVPLLPSGPYGWAAYHRKHPKLVTEE